ncbi:unnamed protein product [Caenorhabditis nigoni]
MDRKSDNVFILPHLNKKGNIVRRRNNIEKKVNTKPGVSMITVGTVPTVLFEEKKDKEKEILRNMNDS